MATPDLIVARLLDEDTEHTGDDPGMRAGEAGRFLMSGFPFVLVALTFAVSLTVRFRHALQPEPTVID